jgi:hypothetical protein
VRHLAGSRQATQATAPISVGGSVGDHLPTKEYIRFVKVIKILKNLFEGSKPEPVGAPVFGMSGMSVGSNSGRGLLVGASLIFRIGFNGVATGAS